MKLKTTRKAIKEAFSHVLKLSYCELQCTLKTADLDPIAYTARAEGWASDIYDVSDYSPLSGSVAISTGYAPFGDTRLNYKITDAAERIARVLMGWGSCGVGPCDVDPFTGDRLDIYEAIKLRTAAGRALLRATLEASLKGEAITIPDAATIDQRYFSGLYTLAERRGLCALRAAINTAGAADLVSDGRGEELPF